MRVRLIVPLLTVSVFLTGSLRAQVPASAGRFQARVDHALDKGVVALLSRRHADGQYDRRLGINALAMLALLHAGVDKKDPVILRLKRHLLAKPTAVYDLALRLMCIDELDDPDLRDLAERSAKQLIRCQGLHGGFHYTVSGRPTKYDNSCSQYGVLGLRAAHNVGIKIPSIVWRRALRHQLRNTASNGGVGYQGPGSRSALTAGGLGTLVVASARTGQDRKSKDIRRARVAIERMKTFLEGHWKPGHGYGDYALERAMAFSRTAKLGERDWYREGAEILCAEQEPSGLWGKGENIVSTSFALLFLSRASAATASETPGSLSDLFGALGPQASTAAVKAVSSKLIARGRGVVPALVPYLMSEYGTVRAASVKALRALTGQSLGYEPSRRPAENRAAIARWRAAIK